VGERLLRELQRPTPGRTPERRNFLLAGRGQGRDRKLAPPLQHSTPALIPGLPPAGTAGRAMAGFAPSGPASPATPALAPRPTMHLWTPLEAQAVFSVKYRRGVGCCHLSGF